MNSDEVLYNVMLVLGKVYNRQKALQAEAFQTEDGKLVMAETLATLELLIDLYGPSPEQPPAKRGFIDGILGR